MNIMTQVVHVIQQEYSSKIHYGKLIFGIAILAYVVNAIHSPQEFHIINIINLIFHEAGHTLAFLFGKFTYFIAGSAVQVLIPTVFATYFFLKKEFYSSGIVMMWVGQSFTNVSVYVGDAQTMLLPLLGGDAVEHDWNTILTMVGLLDYTTLLAQGTYFCGLLIVVIGAFLATLGSRHSSR